MEKNAIYIVEDSHIDLGLLVTVERNLQRIMEIIADYLVWNSKGPSTTHREGEDAAHDVSDEDGSNETQVQNYLPSQKSLRSMASRPSDSSPTLYSVMPLFGFGRRKKTKRILLRAQTLQIHPNKHLLQLRIHHRQPIRLTFRPRRLPVRISLLLQKSRKHPLLKTFLVKPNRHRRLRQTQKERQTRLRVRLL